MLPARRLSLPQLVSLGVAAAAAAVLIGWTFDIVALQRLMPHSVAMNPATAVAFIITAWGLWHAGAPRKRLAAAGLIAAIGTARLVAYAGGWDLGLDVLLFPSKTAGLEGGLPNRMAPNTALNFIAVAAALLLLGKPGRRNARLSESMLLAVFLNTFVAFLGYVYDAPALYRPTPFIGMAVHTAACFVALSLGLLTARADHPVAAIMASPHSGGTMARALIPAAMLLLPALGWVRLQGELMGLYDMRVGLSLMVIFSILPTTAIILRTAVSIGEKEAERLLSEQRLAHALDLSGSAVVSVDSDQRISFFDARAERLFGYSSGEVLGRPLDTLLPARFGMEHHRHVQAFAASADAARLMGQRRDVFGARRDGSEFPAEVAISKSTQNGAVLLTAVVRDISERKRAEKETLRAERLAAANQELEAFSYSVSHDLRAPLRHIDGFIGILRGQAGPALDERARATLDTIADASKRMGTLIDDLLAFSRMSREQLRKSRQGLSEPAAEALGELRRDEVGADWRIGPLPEAEFDRAMLKLVFSNLIGNALKFSRTRPTPIIEIGGEERDGEAVVFVRDNGVGFDPSYAHKLFGVFQRLHRQEEFEGTGIGLANVRRIIDRHGGRTWAESEPGKGACFYFSLPLNKESPS